MNRFLYKFFFCMAGIMTVFSCSAQLYDRLTWSPDGNRFYLSDQGAITEYGINERTQHILVSPQRLTPKGGTHALDIKNFFFCLMTEYLMGINNTFAHP